MRDLKLVTYTNRLRRTARRGGMKIIKTKTLAPGAAADTGYMLVRCGDDHIIAGRHFSATLADIAKALQVDA